MELTNREIVGLYLFLAKHEDTIDIEMTQLQNKLRNHLFDSISIHQLEKLESLYQQGIDVLK